MKKLIWIGLAFLVVLVGCDLVSRDFYRAEDDYTGTLVLLLDTSSIPTTKIIQPDPSDIVMQANAFDISLDYAGDSSLDTGITDLTGGNHTFYALTPGTWNIGITAYDSDSTGSHQVVGALGGDEAYRLAQPIDAGEVIVLTNLSIVPIVTKDTVPATGLLGDLNLIWPADITPTGAGVDAVLIPLDQVQVYAADPVGYAGPSTDLNFIVTGNTANYAQTAIGVGYYGLFITIINDPLGTPTTVTGITESVRLVADHVSSGNIDLQRKTGTLTLNWDVDLQNPVGIDLTHNDIPPEELVLSPPNESKTVTANFDDSNAQSDSYQFLWFVDGAAMGTPATHSDLSVPFEYVLNYTDFTAGSGAHHLSLLIFGLNASAEVETIGSETLTFAVE